MQKNYEECLETILHHEGGYVNHPKDPGGETNLGVTKRVYEAYCERKGLKVKKMKSLKVKDVAPIYKEEYWDRLKGDDLPAGLDLCVFDFGVNAGTGRAAKYLQQMIGATPDGGIGPMTLKALQEYIDEIDNDKANEDAGLHQAITNYQEMRTNYYKKLGTFETFGRGWLRRVDETTSKAFGLI